MDLLWILKWVLIWAVVTGVVYMTCKITYNLITKPNLRYYVAKTLKDVRHMYNRYHV